MGLNLTKEVKSLYTENYFKNDEINGKILCVNILEEFILLKCPSSPERSIDSI